MSFLTKGILLEQHKEPMLSRNILVMRHEYEYFECDFPEVPVEELSREQIIEVARLAEIVDDTDGKLLADKLEEAMKSGKKTLVIDAVDDEPYISSQMTLVFHKKEKLALGIRLCSKVLEPDDAYVAVYEHIFDINVNLPKKVGEFPVRKIGGFYPAENRMYGRINRKEHIVFGAGAMVHLARAAEESRKMTSCFITVAGDAITNPRNIEVPIGTTVSKIFELCGLVEDPEAVSVGGTMTGRSVLEPDEEKVEVLTKGVIAMSRNSRSLRYRCIGCGRCDHACPQILSPSRIRLLVEFGKFNELAKYDPDHCIGCGSCSYVCPAKLDVAASVLKAKKAEIARKESAK